MKSNAFLHSIYAVLLLVFLGMGSVYAQLPGIPYQAYIMDKNAGYAVGEQLTNIPLANSQVMLQFEIRNAAGTVEYAEQISVPTDAYGLLSTTIGAGIGTVTTGSFAGIAWDGTKKTLYAKIDFSNTGNAFEDHGMVELHYMPAPNLPEAEGLTTSTGAPTATNPAGAEAGDIYVDESTGDVFTYADTDGDGVGDTWTTQSGVSADANNLVVEGSDGLAFMDEAAIQGASGTTTGAGAPTATNPAGAEAGDIYVDENTGEIYTHDGNGWVENKGSDTGTGTPTATNPAGAAAGDIYVDESTGDVFTYADTDGDGVGDTWVTQSGVSADADNLVVEGSDGLAYLDEAAIQGASGTTTSTGAPTATSPAGAVAGDIYVDESTGDVFTYADTDGDGVGDTWVTQSGVSADANNLVVEGSDGLAYLDEAAIQGASGTTTSTGAPTATSPAGAAAGDIYVDESTGDVFTYADTDGDGVGDTWVTQSGVSADADNLVVEGSDGLAYLDEAAIQGASGTTTSTGAPTATNPAGAEAGDIYVDESTGDVFTCADTDGDGVGEAWVTQSGVSADADNLVVEGSDGLAYLDEAAIQGASGTTTGAGAPTATNPAGAAAGDIYVDENTGEIYTHDGNGWVENKGSDTGTGAPTATSPAGAVAGDIYVDESTGDVFTYADTDGDGVGDTWISQTDAAGNSFAVTDAAADITLDDTHDILWVDATAGDINVTLPAASSVSGRAYTVVKADGSANNLVFSETITGSAFTFTQVNVPGSYRLQSNGTNWLLLK